MAKGTKSPASAGGASGTDVLERVASLIYKCDANGVAEAVRVLDATGRRAVAKALPGHVKAVQARRGEGILEYAPAFRVAGAGTLTGASAVAAWLNRREFSPRWSRDHEDTELLLGLWDDRDDAWLADLAQRLTLRLRGPEHVGLDLVLALLARTGIEPPDHDPLVVGWVSLRWMRPLVDDPLRRSLLPRIFEADGVGRELRDHPLWTRELPRLADRGVVDRRMLLDGCVRRFLRGGTQNDLRFFVQLHDQLMPDDPATREVEVRARARDYVRLLPAAPGTVAGLALGLLREVPELPLELVVEALDGVLFRAESGLVKSGLSRLEQIIRQSPALAVACAPALAQAFGHESPAMQTRAVRIALKLPDGVDAAAFTDAVPLLPPELGAKLAARFGGDVAEPEPAAPPPPFALVPPTPDPLPPLPPPITTVAELAAAIQDGVPGWAAEEQLMAGVVRLAGQDAEGVGAAFKHVLPSHCRWSADLRWMGTHTWVRRIGYLLNGSGPLPHDWRERLPSARDIGGTHLLQANRCAELYAGIEDGSLAPFLLATPTEPTGHIDPMTLVERLERLQAADAEPGAADFQAALLRLPRDIDPEVVRRASALTTTAGRAAASLLAAGGLPFPEVSTRLSGHGRPEAVISAPPTGLPLVDAVFTVQDGPSSGVSGSAPPRPSLLPSYPEVVAAHLVPLLPGGTSNHAYTASIQEIIGLVPGNGPFAEVVGHYLACLIFSLDAEEALHAMAARGDLPAAAFGRHLGRLVLDGDAKLVSVVKVLDRLAEEGAYADVWKVIAAALPVLCAGPGVRPASSLDRLIALGLRTARWSGARGAIPELDVLASRKGSANVFREARALAAYLR